MSSVATNERAPPTEEARSGLDPWVRAEMPVPPMPRGLGWIAVVGPGVIVLGLSIGSGEFLLGPAVFVKHGLTLLWVTAAAILFQTIFNTEVMRYTLATGEPVFTGFMRTRPSSTFWAWFYIALYFMQFGWPAWAATGAGALLPSHAHDASALKRDETGVSEIVLNMQSLPSMTPSVGSGASANSQQVEPPPDTK